MKLSTADIKQALAPYSGIIRFMLVLVIAHFAWKFTVLGDEGSNAVTFFGCDISAPFIWMSAHVASITHTLLQWLGYNVVLTDDTTLCFINNHSVRIIWACTGLKQMFIFCCILLFSKGPWRQKLWFVPMGVVSCYVINILRITALSMVVYHRPEWFFVSHEYITKYLFYGIIFLFWVWWEEKFNVPNQTVKQ